jgi:peptidyl-tRNA hydrolase, PTH1 family
MVFLRYIKCNEIFGIVFRGGGRVRILNFVSLSPYPFLSLSLSLSLSLPLPLSLSLPLLLSLLPLSYLYPMSKFLIACLGNIGEEYANTRHNVGFLVADALVESLSKDEGISSSKLFQSDRLANVCHARFKGRQLVIIKPTTYMNLSGKAVNYWMQAEKITVHSLLVITDDLALPFGSLRVRKKGSDGGHNGLSDIIKTLNTTEFARLRFGIGNEFSKGQQVDYVLGEWSKDESAALPERIEKSVEIVKSFVTIGVDRTMSGFNNK